VETAIVADRNELSKISRVTSLMIMILIPILKVQQKFARRIHFMPLRMRIMFQKKTNYLHNLNYLSAQMLMMNSLTSMKHLLENMLTRILVLNYLPKYLETPPTSKV